MIINQTCIYTQISLFF